jgi:hypothetical protein
MVFINEETIFDTIKTEVYVSLFRPLPQAKPKLAPNQAFI